MLVSDDRHCHWQVTTEGVLILVLVDVGLGRLDRLEKEKPTES